MSQINQMSPLAIAEFLAYVVVIGGAVVSVVAWVAFMYYERRTLVAAVEDIRTNHLPHIYKVMQVMNRNQQRLALKLEIAGLETVDDGPPGFNGLPEQ